MWEWGLPLPELSPSLHFHGLANISSAVTWPVLTRKYRDLYLLLHSGTLGTRMGAVGAWLGSGGELGKLLEVPWCPGGVGPGPSNLSLCGILGFCGVRAGAAGSIVMLGLRDVQPANQLGSGSNELRYAALFHLFLISNDLRFEILLASMPVPVEAPQVACCASGSSPFQGEGLGVAI